MMFKLTEIGLPFLLSACNDPSAANKENFGKAVQEYLDTQPAICVELPLTDSYTEKQLSLTPSSDHFVIVLGKDSIFDNSADRLKYAEAFEKQGLLTKTQKQVEIDEYGTMKKYDANIYTLTDKAKSLLKSGGFNNQLCTGKFVLEQVTNFTQPSDAFGMKISRVMYTAKASELADWAKDQAFLESVSHSKYSTPKLEIDAKMALILTNEGWKNEHMMKSKH
ncbi:MAG: hypothetical protein Q4A81_00595 [Pasteurellaceae bacterium]|nr:hypothetical protein [Pasteurellaceae bacterium]